MTPVDAAVVLAFAAGFDQRTVGEQDAEAWADALFDVERADAIAAVRAFYRQAGAGQRVWIGDIRDYVRPDPNAWMNRSHWRHPGQIDYCKTVFDPETRQWVMPPPEDDV